MQAELGRREPAEDLAANDDAGRHKSGDRDPGGAEELPPRRAWVGRIAARLGVNVHRCHLREPDQQARDDAGQEQRTDRDGENAAPDDHQDRGRNDHGKNGGYGRDRDGEAVVVAFFSLRLDEDFGLAGGIGGRGAGDASEEDREHHVDLRQPTREVTHHRAGQFHQAVRRAADVHQVSRQQKEWDGEQDERIVGVERLLHERHRVEPRLDEQDGQTRYGKCEGDRHAQEHGEKKQAEQDQRCLSGRKNRARHARLPAIRLMSS